MPGRRMRNSLAVMGALLPFAAFAEGQPQAVTTSSDTARVAPALERYSDRVLGEVGRRPGLSRRDRSIVTTAAVIARNQTIEMSAELRRALDNGVKPSELSEIITHLAFYSGWANAVAAVGAAEEVFVERKIGTDQLPAANAPLLPLDAAAEAQRAASVEQSAGPVSPGLVQYTGEVLFRDLWLRPGLAPRDRSLVTVTALVALGQVAQIPFHLNRAMDNGLTRAEASEMLAHLAFYAGWPNVFSAVPVVREVFEKRPSMRLTSVAVAAVASMQAQAASFTVTVVPPVHGTLQLVPPLPPDGKYPAGTVVTLRATPDRGYVLDSAWYSVPGRFGQMYHEGMGSEFAVTIDRDKRVGASFIEEAAVAHIDVTQDVVYAKPGVKPLKYDVFSPKGARDLPVIVIIHGGGWVANDENIMRGLARELTKGGRFVVFSMDYRWAGKEDGDATSTTMANIIEDVFGGIAHIMEHAKEYGGDPTRIGVTGDSAGGHLAAVASLMPNMMGSRGFGKTPGVFEFMPSYLPKAKTVEQVRSEMVAAIKAAAPSYGVFRATRLNLYTDDPAADESWKQAVAPLQHIPAATERAVPQFQVRGTRDGLVHHDDVQEFLDALVEAGQRAEYIQVGGAGHAFFDWKPDESTKATFAKYGVYYAAAMKAFFESVLY